jgi:hypothetical protein
MRMNDVGWVWEGQGLDPGVHPSIFGVGEGADFFGLRKVRFLFHPTTDLVLTKLAGKKEVFCDISKWLAKDTEDGGSTSYGDTSLETVIAEAEKIGRFSLAHPNVTGCFYDDMKGLMRRENLGADACAQVYEAVKRHNPALRLACVVYSHELDPPSFWEPLAPYMDEISFWVWSYEDLQGLEDHLTRCRDVFQGKPVIMGCYLRDYSTRSPIPMDALKFQWEFVARALADGRLDAYEILGTVLIDGQLQQAEWVRDFIRDNS